MARIIVQADDESTVLFDEKGVRGALLIDRHYAGQLLERLEWAVEDAEGRPFGPPRQRKRNASGVPSPLQRALN